MPIDPLSIEDVKAYLTAGAANWTRPQAVPVRYWPNPNTMLLGYMEIGAAETDGDTVRYTLTFRMSPLTEPPRYDIRFDMTQEATDA